MAEPVRPTRRALSDLGLTFPRLDVPLATIDHPLVVKAQGLPEAVQAGGAERIVSITDRTWFKVKTQDYRGAAGDVPSGNDPAVPDHSWWLAAAGHRRADTPTQDFYSRLTTECERAGRGSGGVISEGLLPQETDYKRWYAELATLAVTAMQGLIRKAIVKSAHDGKLWTVTVQHHVIGALVRTDDGETYLAVTAEGYYDARLVAVLLDSVPGVAADDWIAEPGPVLGINPNQGQIVFSTMLPPTSLASLLDADDGDYL
ncbi:hypothetical protein [Cellulomonas sp. NTE-D12]|uniref:hypothetical protein n=1 Tax=Cellulomonas sp. NTE-D12 TaxID=2962632 RepID=UPI003081AAFB